VHNDRDWRRKSARFSLMNVDCRKWDLCFGARVLEVEDKISRGRIGLEPNGRRKVCLPELRETRDGTGQRFGCPAELWCMLKEKIEALFDVGD
jgi:hypothetical protein